MLPDLFHGKLLKREVRDRVLETLHAAGLKRGDFSCYAVGPLVTEHFREFDPLQFIVTLSKQSAVDFNEQIGKYLTGIEFPDLKRKVEFAFQNGILDLSSYPAVYDVTHGVWFKGEPVAEPELRGAQRTYDGGSGTTITDTEAARPRAELKSIVVELPTTGKVAVSPQEFVETLKRHFPYFLRLEDADPGEVQLTTYATKAQELIDVVQSYWQLVGKQRAKPKQRDWSATEVQSFHVTLPVGIQQDQLEQFLRGEDFQRFIATQSGPKRVKFEVYAQDAARLKQLVDFFLQEEAEPAGLSTAPPPAPLVELKVAIDSVSQNRLNLFSRSYGKQTGRRLNHYDAGGFRVFRLTDPKDRGALETALRQELPGVRIASLRAASAFISDIRFGDLPKDTQKDILQFQKCRADDLIPSYGMVVSELLPKADPHNLDSAREHVKDTAKKTLEKEIYGKAETKYLLLTNDRLIDGHHYLAKAERAGVTRTLRVLDLTPLRFQKRKAEYSYAQPAGTYKPCPECGGEMQPHPEGDPTIGFRGSICCQACGHTTPGMSWRKASQTIKQVAVRLGQHIYSGGQTHSECFRYAADQGADTQTERTDGFLTSSGRFVERAEAYRLAQAAGQTWSNVEDGLLHSYNVRQATLTYGLQKRVAVLTWGDTFEERRQCLVDQLRELQDESDIEDEFRADPAVVAEALKLASTIKFRDGEDVEAFADIVLDPTGWSTAAQRDRLMHYMTTKMRDFAAERGTVGGGWKWKGGSLREDVGMAIGEASTCWSNLEGAGTFDSTHAIQVADKLLARIQLSNRQATKKHAALDPHEIVPAIRITQESGTVILVRGQKGDTHQDILNRYIGEHPEDAAEALMGFDAPENPNFFLVGDQEISRAELQAELGVRDSQGLKRLQAPRIALSNRTAQQFTGAWESWLDQAGKMHDIRPYETHADWAIDNVLPDDFKEAYEPDDQSDWGVKVDKAMRERGYVRIQASGPHLYAGVPQGELNRRQLQVIRDYVLEHELTDARDDNGRIIFEPEPRQGSLIYAV